MSKDFIFASRSVTEGHPDKVCDLISDAAAGLFMRQDPASRVSVECAAAKGVLFIAARFASKAMIDLPATARDVIRQVGYEEGDFSARSCSIMTSINERSMRSRVEAAETGLNERGIEGLHVSDQITILGFACNHTESFMPLPISLAHRLARRLDTIRHEGILAYLAPDGRAQVAVEFRDRKPCRLYSIDLIAAQTAAGRPALQRLREDLREHVLEPVFAGEALRPDSKTRIGVNVEGAVIGGGPGKYAGLTGRKLGVDTYGDYARHSSMALSGKDPFRIGRTGAYAARYAAKNVVAAGLADECEVQMSYAPGYPGPISLQVETFGTGRIADSEIVERIQRVFDFRLGALVRDFRLLELPREHADGFFRKLAVYGQVGRIDLELPWEMIDKQDALAG